MDKVRGNERAVPKESIKDIIGEVEPVYSVAASSLDLTLRKDLAPDGLMLCDRVRITSSLLSSPTPAPSVRWMTLPS